MREEVQPDAGVVDDAVDVVEHPLPHLSGDDGRNRPGNEHHRPHRSTPAEVRVDDEGNDHAEHELEADRDEGELDRRPDRGSEDAVVPELSVVVKADPLRRLDPGQELLVREAVVDRLAQWIDRHKADDRERRQEHQPAETGLAPLQASPAASTRDGGWCGDGAHSESRGRMTDAILPRLALAWPYLVRLFSFEAMLGSTLLAGVPLRIWLTPW